MYNLAPNQENNITDQGTIYQNNKLVNKVPQQVIKVVSLQLHVKCILFCTKTMRIFYQVFETEA